ncbi:hypothetical protein N9Y89_00225 [bacterium]|nr:hypothetical protein [bacterium]
MVSEKTNVDEIHDLQKIPSHLLDLEDPIFEFNKQIIDATSRARRSN